VGSRRSIRTGRTCQAIGHRVAYYERRCERCRCKVGLRNSSELRRDPDGALRLHYATWYEVIPCPTGMRIRYPKRGPWSRRRMLAHYVRRR